MSSILKAIRKVEDEKRAGQGVAPDLMVDHGVPAERPRTLLPLLAGVTLGALLVGLFFAFFSREPAQVAQQQPQADASARPEITGTAPPSKEGALSPVIQPKATPEPVMTVDREKDAGPVVLEQAMLPEPVVAAPPAKPAAAKDTRPAFEPSPPVTTQAVMATVTTQAVPQQPAAPVEAKASPLPSGIVLLVSEIFHQEEDANSMAVVNDLPVMVGTHIDDAVVIAIHPDHVVFQIAEASYRVPLKQP